jgi:hypothetical protein
MKVIIPYRQDNQTGEELRFAIRSLVKYFTDFTELILVGDLPKWYKGEHIPYRDLIGRVDFNMYLKLMAGAKGETVLYTQDDVFALKPFDKNIPNYYNGTCGERALTVASGRHKKQYKNCPPEWLNFDVHTPMIIDTSKFTWQGKFMHTDRPVKSNYGGQNNLIGEPLADLKFGNSHDFEQIKSLIDGKPFFSTSPFCMNASMIKVLQELFPIKSEYEK